MDGWMDGWMNIHYKKDIGVMNDGWMDGFLERSMKEHICILCSTQNKCLTLVFSVSPSFLTFRFKTSALSLSRIHKSHPVPPGLRLTQWVEHILHSGGGAHLRPMAYVQPGYQQWLLDILLLFSLVPLGFVVLCWAMVRRGRDRERHAKMKLH